MFEGDRRRQGVPAVGVPVVEGLGPEVGAEEGVEDVAGRHGGRHGEIAAGDPLAEAQQIGAQARLLGGEERAGAAEARGHLVADQEHVVRVGTPHRPGARSDGGGHQHARRTLHEGLDHHRGQLAGVGLDGRAGLGGPAGVGVAGRAQHREAERVEDRAEDAAVAERERADGVAVVGVAQGEKAGAPVIARLIQYWKAILRACSTATAPSAAKRKWGSSTGTTPASASASSTTAVLPLPSMVEWATLAAWATGPRRARGRGGRGC